MQKATTSQAHLHLLAMTLYCTRISVHAFPDQTDSTVITYSVTKTGTLNIDDLNTVVSAVSYSQEALSVDCDSLRPVARQ